MILKEGRKIHFFVLELWGLVRRPYSGYVSIHGHLEECCNSWSIRNPAEFALSWGNFPSRAFLWGFKLYNFSSGLVTVCSNLLPPNSFLSLFQSQDPGSDVKEQPIWSISNFSWLSTVSLTTLSQVNSGIVDGVSGQWDELKTVWTADPSRNQWHGV